MRMRTISIAHAHNLPISAYGMTAPSRAEEMTNIRMSAHGAV